MRSSKRSPYIPLVSETEIKALAAARAHYADTGILESARDSLQSVREASLALLGTMLAKATGDAQEVPKVSAEVVDRYASYGAYEKNTSQW